MNKKKNLKKSSKSKVKKSSKVKRVVPLTIKLNPGYKIHLSKGKSSLSVNKKKIR